MDIIISLEKREKKEYPDGMLLLRMCIKSTERRLWFCCCRKLSLAQAFTRYYCIRKSSWNRVRQKIKVDACRALPSPYRHAVLKVARFLFLLYSSLNIGGYNKNECWNNKNKKRKGYVLLRVCNCNCEKCLKSVFISHNDL